MDKKTEALKLALEALEQSRVFVTTREKIKHPEGTDWYDERITALREALAEQPAQQEPVAWMFQHEETGRTMCVDAQQVEWGFEKGNPRLKKIAPLYTSPQPSKPWVGLTDEEIEDAWPFVWRKHESVRHFAIYHAIEAKLREKNNG